LCWEVVRAKAFKFYDHTSLKPADEANLVFFGLVGMIDPRRREVKQAVQECITAGIRPILITGDYPLTAGYIAGELGINSPGGRVITWAELDPLTINPK
jgi:Ca2+-transporting ATPase